MLTPPKDAFETDIAFTWRHEDIFIIKTKKGAIVSEEQAIELYYVQAHYFKNEKSFFIIDIRDIGGLTPEARHVGQKVEYIEKCHKVAIIAHSPFTKMLGNLVISFSKYKEIVKLFPNDTEAIKWFRS